MPRMTPFKHRFVAEYLSDPDRNATQALIRAGSKGAAKNHSTHAFHLLREDCVIEAIAKHELNRNFILQRTADDISKKRWEIIDNPLSLPNDVLTALRDESKRYAEFTEKHELKAQVENVERRYVGIDVSLV